jgi:ATP-binding cassette, subfamily F, member 3
VAASAAANGKQQKRVNPIKLKQMQERLKFVEGEIPRVETLIGEAEQSLGVFVSVEETARVTSELDVLRDQHSALTKEWEELMVQVEDSQLA